MGISQRALTELTGTRGWARLVGVIAILAGIGIFILGLVGAQQFQRAFTPFSGVPSSAFSTGVLVATTILAALCVTYGGLLLGFTTRVSRLLNTASHEDLVSSMRRLRAFWIFFGIVTSLWFAYTLFNLLGGSSLTR